MPNDADFRVGIGFDVDTSGLQKTEQGLKNTASAVNQAEQKTQSFRGQIGRLQGTIEKLSGSFPLLGEAMRLAFNPVVAITEVAVKAFQAAKASIDALANSVKELPDNVGKAKKSFAEYGEEVNTVIARLDELMAKMEEARGGDTSVAGQTQRLVKQEKNRTRAQLAQVEATATTDAAIIDQLVATGQMSAAEGNILKARVGVVAAQGKAAIQAEGDKRVDWRFREGAARAAMDAQLAAKEAPGAFRAAAEAKSEAERLAQRAAAQGGVVAENEKRQKAARDTLAAWGDPAWYEYITPGAMGTRENLAYQAGKGGDEAIRLARMAQASALGESGAAARRAAAAERTASRLSARAVGAAGAVGALSDAAADAKFDAVIESSRSAAEALRIGADAMISIKQAQRSELGRVRARGEEQ